MLGRDKGGGLNFLRLAYLSDQSLRYVHVFSHTHWFKHLSILPQSYLYAQHAGQRSSYSPFQTAVANIGIKGVFQASIVRTQQPSFTVHSTTQQMHIQRLSVIAAL